MVIKITGETGKGRVSCGHQTYPGEPYYLQSGENIYSYCQICGSDLKVSKVLKGEQIVEPIKI